LPLPTQYRYRFTTFLAGAQGLFAHPVSIILFGKYPVRISAEYYDLDFSWFFSVISSGFRMAACLEIVLVLNKFIN
jgi:hypothetical protein